MIILLIFAFISGLVTILAPCIWPLLPIILSSTTSGGHRKPLGITLGLMVSFGFFTLTISYIVRIFHFNPDILRNIAVLVIGFLGLTLAIPKLSQILEGFVSKISSRFAPTNSSIKQNGFASGYITGFSLGMVWSPCAGPILATIATLAATQSVNLEIILVTLAYITGLGIPLFILATLGNKLFTQTKFISPYLGRIQQIFGIIMLLTAFAIYTGYDRILQAQLLEKIPSYSSFLYALEGNKTVKDKLEKIRGGNMPMPSPNTVFDLTDPKGTKRGSLPNFGKAPELVGIVDWLNLPAGRQGSDPKTLEGLKGKVVLVDFWTYSCINCIRSLPHVTAWYEKYKDYGFVVLGIHTPEFEFEKSKENVANAINQYKITYPVGLDNNYNTWQAYDNHYWPAKYLIDHQGNLRYYHFGEGEYDQTEQAIQSLLSETGAKSDLPLVKLDDQTPQARLTPETYLGFLKMENFSSNESSKKGLNTYTPPSDLSSNFWQFTGSWDIEDEYSSSSLGSVLELKFNAKKVFLVITPQTVKDSIKVFLDGKGVDQTNKGVDVGGGVLNVSESRLYELINLPKIGTHTLRLEFETAGTKIYAFTFGS